MRHDVMRACAVTSVSACFLCVQYCTVWVLIADRRLAGRVRRTAGVRYGVHNSTPLPLNNTFCYLDFGDTRDSSLVSVCLIGLSTEYDTVFCLRRGPAPLSQRGEHVRAPVKTFTAVALPHRRSA